MFHFSGYYISICLKVSAIIRDCTFCNHAFVYYKNLTIINNSFNLVHIFILFRPYKRIFSNKSIRGIELKFQCILTREYKSEYS